MKGHSLREGAFRLRQLLAGIIPFGKEANRWEERLFSGEDPEVQIAYRRSRRERQHQAREIGG